MALPKIDLPLYTTEIPTTGKTVSYRPFLVKEEKILLMALESGEEENIHNATLQIIRNCVPKAGAGNVQKTLNTIAKCIDVIFDGDDIFPAKSSSEEELLEFLDNLNSEQFQQIQKFIANIPKLHKTVKHKCEACGDVIVHEVEGLSSFFG